MAQGVTIILEDDIDGSEATQTVTFALDGSSYEIDLNDKHADKFRAALTGYITAGPQERRRGPSTEPSCRRSQQRSQCR